MTILLRTDIKDYFTFGIVEGNIAHKPCVTSQFQTAAKPKFYVLIRVSLKL